MTTEKQMIENIEIQANCIISLLKDEDIGNLTITDLDFLQKMLYELKRNLKNRMGI